MNLYIWDQDKYSVGHPELDKQHQTIFNLLDRLVGDFNESFSEELYRYTLKELIGYTEWHLHFEEKLIRKIGFEQLDDHLVAHEIFSQRVSELNESYERGLPQTRRKIISFLGYWVNQHILIEDMQYKPAMVDFVQTN